MLRHQFLPFLVVYTCDKQVLLEGASFFPRDNSLISDRKSHNSDFLGLAVRCLLFNPEGPGSNPCLCAKVFRSRRFSLFSTMRLPLPLFGFLRLIFEIFLMSPKGPPFILLIFCKRTNVKKFPKVSSFRFFGTMRLLKIRIFLKFFRSLQMVPLQFFFEISRKNE